MTKPAALKPPRTLEQATPKIERVAVVDHELTLIAANRAEAIASTNAIADRLAAPLLEERARLVAELEPWWKGAAAGLLKGKRKSVELGGCDIGTKAKAASVTHTHQDDDAAIEKIMGVAWARKLLIRVKHELNLTAIKAMLAAEPATAADRRKLDELKALGFSLPAPTETFFVGRKKQQDTVAKAAE